MMTSDEPVARGETRTFGSQLGARMDRALWRREQPQAAAAHLTSFSTDIRDLAPSRSWTRRAMRSRFFAPVKRLLTQGRMFMAAPVNGKIDGLAGSLSIQQRLLGQISDRLDASDRRLRLLDQEMTRRMAELAQVQRSVGNPHIEVDEGTIRWRPVIHLGDAYALSLRDGYVIVPETEEGVLLMLAGAGPDGLEPGMRRVLQAVASDGSIAVDVGVGMGLHTLALARAVGSRGRVFAFEVETRLERYLLRTFRANGLDQVDLRMLAVGSRSIDADPYGTSAFGDSSCNPSPNEEESREVVKLHKNTLDESLPERSQIAVLKIAVGGAELDVLAGAARTIGRSPDCVIIAEYRSSNLARGGAALEDWIGSFSAGDRTPYVIGEPDGVLMAVDASRLAARQAVKVAFMRDESFAALDLTKRGLMARA